MRPIFISAGILAAVGVGWFLTQHASSLPLAPRSYDQLTPGTLIEWCGEPLQDHVESNPKITSVKYRTLVYPGRETGTLVNVEFMSGNVTGGQFYFNGARLALEKGPQDSHFTFQIEKRMRHLHLDCLP